ncbi:putative pentatricopeptide repeat-containing protein At3g16710, mitochondrial [Pistacia vera]|uniref:putative pentatricopeptide repeat-containing protein At3g16710, mitochondrial n=1 Tax=Pistacia vera TaxID=55513 RepID=UPI00126315F2|nr:putative pentatricopeptide repeat-containing protein At3g16710, mitochondrial [Pistacia vera]
MADTHNDDNNPMPLQILDSSGTSNSMAALVDHPISECDRQGEETSAAQEQRKNHQTVLKTRSQVIIQARRRISTRIQGKRNLPRIQATRRRPTITSRPPKQGSLEAMELFKKMVVFGVRPDIVSYGSIVNGLCKDGLVDKTKELFLEMKSGGIKPNVVVCTTLIYGCCFVRNLEGAKVLFFEMLDQGLQPNLLTYNTMISGFCKEGKIETA